MFCPNCGEKIKASANYCSECGQEINPVSTDEKNSKENNEEEHIKEKDNKKKSPTDNKDNNSSEYDINWHVSIFLVVVSLVFSQIIGIILGISAPFVPFVEAQDIASQSYDTAERIYLLTTVLGYGIFSVLYCGYRSTWFGIQLSKPKSEELEIGLLGLLVVSILYLAYTTLLNIFNISISTSSLLSFSGGLIPTILFCVLSILIIAPSEEIFFRGVIQGGLSSSYGDEIGLLIASVLFALIHIPNFLGTGLLILSGTIFLVYVPIGLVFGYVYQSTQNLLIPILVHGMYNSVVALFSYGIF